MAIEGDDVGRTEVRRRAVLVGVAREKAAAHLSALMEAGMEASVADRVEDVDPSVAARSVLVAPMADGPDICGVVALVAERFPSAVIVALVATVTAAAARAAIGCGASTLVGLDEPVREAAETIYQASVGFSRLWLLRGVAVEVGDAASVDVDEEEVGWLRLLGDDSLTMADVAERSGWSRAHMYRRLRPLFHRLGAGSRREAVLRARQEGILP